MLVRIDIFNRVDHFSRLSFMFNCDPNSNIWDLIDELNRTPTLFATSTVHYAEEWAYDAKSSQHRSGTYSRTGGELVVPMHADKS